MHTRSFRRSACFVVPMLCLFAGAAAAQALPPPENVVGLNASATVEVPRDWMTVTLSTTREGPEASGVQGQLKQALDAALAEARRLARPGDLEVSSGNFSLQPRYTPKGVANGWMGTAELVVQGRDMAAIAQLTGRIQTLTIARLSHSLSRAALERVESEVTAQAVTRFRAKADQAARLFGFTGYLLREVQIGANDSPGVPLPMAMRVRSSAASVGDEPLPVEAGKASVTVSVTGSIQLTK
jgi:predicted secreted protein